MKRLRDSWCGFWCYLIDHTGTGLINNWIVRAAEHLTPADY